MRMKYKMLLVLFGLRYIITSDTYYLSSASCHRKRNKPQCIMPLHEYQKNNKPFTIRNVKDMIVNDNIAKSQNKHGIYNIPRSELLNKLKIDNSDHNIEKRNNCKNEQKNLRLLTKFIFCGPPKNPNEDKKLFQAERPRSKSESDAGSSKKNTSNRQLEILELSKIERDLKSNDTFYTSSSTPSESFHSFRNSSSEDDEIVKLAKAFEESMIKKIDEERSKQRKLDLPSKSTSNPEKAKEKFSNAQKIAVKKKDKIKLKSKTCEKNTEAEKLYEKPCSELNLDNDIIPHFLESIDQNNCNNERQNILIGNALNQNESANKVESQISCKKYEKERVDRLNPTTLNNTKELSKNDEYKGMRGIYNNFLAKQNSDDESQMNSETEEIINHMKRLDTLLEYYKDEQRRMENSRIKRAEKKAKIMNELEEAGNKSIKEILKESSKKIYDEFDELMRVEMKSIANFFENDAKLKTEFFKGEFLTKNENCVHFIETILINFQKDLIQSVLKLNTVLSRREEVETEIRSKIAPFLEEIPKEYSKNIMNNEFLIVLYLEKISVIYNEIIKLILEKDDDEPILSKVKFLDFISFADALRATRSNDNLLLNNKMCDLYNQISVYLESYFYEDDFYQQLEDDTRAIQRRNTQNMLALFEQEMTDKLNNIEVVINEQNKKIRRGISKCFDRIFSKMKEIILKHKKEQTKGIEKIIDHRNEETIKDVLKNLDKN